MFDTDAGRRHIELLTPLFPRYCFIGIELQWHGVVNVRE
jgi:hypothetical protein